PWHVFCASVLILMAQAVFSAPTPAERADTSKSRRKTSSARIHDFKIVRPRFIVHGTRLSKVEIWFSSTGTSIDGPGLLGTATRIADGRAETWALPIPRDLLAVEIFAVAFDNDSKVVGK